MRTHASIVADLTWRLLVVARGGADAPIGPAGQPAEVWGALAGLGCNPSPAFAEDFTAPLVIEHVTTAEAALRDAFRRLEASRQFERRDGGRWRFCGG